MSGWDQQAAMIEAQAHQITKLRKDLRESEDRYQNDIGDHRRNMKAASFYYQLQAAIVANPMLQSEWERFCSMLKMASVDDIEHEKPPKKLDAPPVPEDVAFLPHMY